MSASAAYTKRWRATAETPRKASDTMRTRKWLVSAGGTRVAGMQVTFVFDGEIQRREFLGEPPPQSLCAGGAVHGGAASGRAASGRAGFVLPLSHSTCGIMKSSIATLMPKTLKFTQTLSAKFRAT